MAQINSVNLPTILNTVTGAYFDPTIPAALHNPMVDRRPFADTHMNGVDSEFYRMKLLQMRLRIPEGRKLPFHDLFTSLSGDTVFVFVVQDNQAVTLEDSAVMFPSDQLITQLRLLHK